MNEKRREIIGLLLIALGILTLLSLVSYNPIEEPTISKNVVIRNWMGIIGVAISYFLIKYSIGAAAFIIPILLVLWGWWTFSKRNIRVLLRFTIYIVIISVIVSTSLALPTIKKGFTGLSGFQYSGMVGGVLAKTSCDFMGFYGTIVFLVFMTLITIRGYFSWNFYGPFERLTNRKKNVKREKKDIKNTVSERVIPEKSKKKFLFFGKNVEADNEPELDDYDRPMEPPKPKSSKKSKKKKKSKDREQPFSIEQEQESSESTIKSKVAVDRKKRKYQLPQINYLNSEPVNNDQVSKEEMQDNGRRLEEALETFKVRGKVVNVLPGPVITMYEIEPAQGIRVSRIAALSDDLARILKATRIRIIAPIPGKSVIGIEIPNRHQAVVFLKSIISSRHFINSKSILPIALGKTTSGEVYTIDLTKMPHLLVAGATGSGKSVCINMIISSILYRAKPEEVKFVLIDPKKLELSAYKALVGYHLTTCEDLDEFVVTKPENAIVALRSVEMEMERRYDILSGATVRNIEEFNNKVIKGHIDQEYLPYIVVVIDELADLMMTSSKEVEEPITRLAQMARAVGIHLIIATQRPSVDVITGIIKANFPARIAFQVTSKIDSRTILDINGAEKLLGRGDLLLTTPQHPEPKRLHSAYISLEELEKILDHIKSQPKPEKIALPSVQEEEADEINGFVSGERDPLFDDALRLIVTHQQGSISLLQRRLKVGYSRAARIIDQLEDAGIVGSFSGSKAREVLVDEDYLDDIYNLGEDTEEEG